MYLTSNALTQNITTFNGKAYLLFSNNYESYDMVKLSEAFSGAFSIEAFNFTRTSSVNSNQIIYSIPALTFTNLSTNAAIANTLIITFGLPPYPQLDSFPVTFSGNNMTVPNTEDLFEGDWVHDGTKSIQAISSTVLDTYQMSLSSNASSVTRMGKSILYKGVSTVTTVESLKDVSIKPINITVNFLSDT